MATAKKKADTTAAKTTKSDPRTKTKEEAPVEELVLPPEMEEELSNGRGDDEDEEGG